MIRNISLQNMPICKLNRVFNYYNSNLIRNDIIVSVNGVCVLLVFSMGRTAVLLTISIY